MIALVPALLAAIFWSPALVGGQVPTFRDFVNTFLPYKLYAARALAAGRLPLWAPEPSLGAPLLANFQSGLLYPFSALIYLWPSPFGVGLYLWLHFFVGAIGIGAFLARRGCPKSAQIFGGIVYVFGGCFVTAAQWSHLTVLAWLPVALVAAERLAERVTPCRFLGLVLVLALQVLGGAPEAFAQSTVLVGAVAWFASGPTPRARRLALIGVALLLALALSAAQLLPTIEYFLDSSRATGVPRGEALNYSFSPATLATLIVPHRLDGGIVRPIVDGTLTLQWSIYVGIAPLLLAVVGLCRHEARLWIAALVIALVLASGFHTPVFPFLYDEMPAIFASFRFPEKFFFTAHVALSVLAALGFARLEGWLAGRGDSLCRLVTMGFCLVTIADLWDVHWPALLYGDWRALVQSAPAVPLRNAGAQARIFGYEPAGAGLRPWVPKFGVGSDLGEVMRRTWSEVAANVPLVYGLGYVNGFDSFHRRSMVELYRQLAEEPSAVDVRLLRAFGVRHWMGAEPLADSGIELERTGGAGRTWIYRTIDPAPRVYLARTVRFVDDVREALLVMGSETFTPGKDAVVTRSSAAAPRRLAVGEARLVDDEPERLAIDVESGGNGFLIVNDSFYPGWTADVDGRPEKILPANGLVRGIEIPPGCHRVTLLYAPRSFRIGVWVSLASVALVWPLACWLTRR